MKFLQVPNIDNLNELLTFETTSGHFVNGRIEVYSCKVAGVDKKLYRYLESKYSEDESDARSLSPEQSYLDDSSPFGPLSQISSRRVFFYLIATLNASFPDYDFRSLMADQFIKHNKVSDVINTVNTTLFNVGCPNLLQQGLLWEEIDNAISLEECKLYAYNPDSESDPYGEEFPVEPLNTSETTPFVSYASTPAGGNSSCETSDIEFEGCSKPKLKPDALLDNQPVFIDDLEL
ncbi:hypothetical protein BB559_002367 [Furculomyces boomerangus]|uniref:Repressor of RNA polymerase III transcription MAF1 n=2 Tax=Harpellales TaxID=61421 RepID=A0A2T9YW05_9FUNG|nr:hypothetical protein BB559_002367 [Furculomyces boomerangus]PVZ99148.1 hypothetical protein BB558_004839 [Smittium angustum]PWA00479.1 hypothetical protein BB558_003478 [Smittium angustum]